MTLAGDYRRKGGSIGLRELPWRMKGSYNMLGTPTLKFDAEKRFLRWLENQWNSEEKRTLCLWRTCLHAFSLLETGGKEKIGTAWDPGPFPWLLQHAFLFLQWSSTVGWRLPFMDSVHLGRTKLAKMWYNIWTEWGWPSLALMEEEEWEFSSMLEPSRHASAHTGHQLQPYIYQLYSTLGKCSIVRREERTHLE